MTKGHVLLDLTLQCFAVLHSSSFVVRFRQISIVESSIVVLRLLREVLSLTSCVALRGDDIDWCQGESSHKYSSDEYIPSTYSSCQRFCMSFSSENNENKGALRGRQHRGLPKDYIDVETTFSFVWAWSMVRKEGWFLETRNLERDLVLRARQGVTRATMALRTYGIGQVLKVLKGLSKLSKECSRCSKDWANWAKKCSRCSRD